MSDNELRAVPNDDLPPLRRLTLADRLLRFVIGAVLAAVVMMALSPLLAPMATDLFFLVTAVGACITGAASAAWGDQFLVLFLRALGRLA